MLMFLEIFLVFLFILEMVFFSVFLFDTVRIMRNKLTEITKRCLFNLIAMNVCNVFVQIIVIIIKSMK